MMTLKNILDQLELPQLDLVTAKDKDGAETDWMRHWENDSRIAISIHKDLVKELQKSPQIDCLGLQKSERVSESSGEPYQSIRIVKYTPAEVTLKAA